MSKSILHDQDLWVSGGAGTWGRALADRRKKEGWTGKMTVFSTDTVKHSKMKRDYPDIQYVCGDIRNFETVYTSMAGADVVIHLAAVKVIPVSEYQVVDTIDVNVNGSLTVAQAAIQLGVKKVVGVSTDKAAHPCNMYGATKKLMEGIFCEYNRLDFPTRFYLTRSGNVLESTGSVVEAWRNAIERGEPIKMTDPDMTRFFLSPSQAIQVILDALEVGMPGSIYVPNMPALSIGKLAAYTIGSGPDFGIERIPLRPGEKKHEELVTIEETERTLEHGDFFVILDSISPKVAKPSSRLSSDIARELTRDELLALLEDK
jgi:UDP-N-acetylglucosamine 4,6-dehydratase/5-epimerase